MTVHEWITLVGVAMSVVLSVTPWMFAVHSRLAVIAARVDALGLTLDKLSSAHEARLAMCIDHESRLEAGEVQLSDLVERMREGR